MNFTLIRDILKLVEDFEIQNTSQHYPATIDGFRQWMLDLSSDLANPIVNEPVWEGKENGRSPESIISTLLVHLNRYAKTYSKSAISGSEFSTQDEFSYLIVLKAFGSMTKMELIKKNIHDKSSGMLIVNRLINHGWILQTDSETDRRSKVLHITEDGKTALERQMERIRNASNIVSGNLNHSEKMELIKILSKLEQFHQGIFSKNIESHKLLETVYQDYSFGKN